MNNVDFKNRIAALARGQADEDDSFLYVKRNAAPECQLRERGTETPSEAWGRRIAQRKEINRLFGQCAGAVERITQ